MSGGSERGDATRRRREAAASEPRPHGRARARTVEEAMGEAVGHARGALSEGLLAARALLDALSIALFGTPADLEPGDLRGGSNARLAIATMGRAIDELALLLASAEHGHSEAVLAAVLDALETEIARWEARSRNDADARAVLRAFLGLREILWEFGVRRSEADTTRDDDTRSRQRANANDGGADDERTGGKSATRGTGEPRRAARSRRDPRRVQRVKVEG